MPRWQRNCDGRSHDTGVAQIERLLSCNLFVLLVIAYLRVQPGAVHYLMPSIGPGRSYSAEGHVVPQLLRNAVVAPRLVEHSLWLETGPADEVLTHNELLLDRSA